MPTARRTGSVPGGVSSSGSPRSISRATPAPMTTSGRRMRAQPATRARPESAPWPTGPSCWPHSARASRTPRVTRPTAHRSRAWTRQNGGRDGAAALDRLAGFLPEERAGARVGARPRVLVTTVRPRLPADLPVSGDTPAVELRTYVRYRRADGTPVDHGGERGRRHALPRRTGGRAAPGPGRLRRVGVPPRQRPHHHQHGAAGEPDALPPHHQRLSRLQPCLRVLLRPAHPRLPGTRDRGRLRTQNRGQGERGGAAARRAALVPLVRRPHRHGDQHRPLPARRGQVPPDPGHRRDPVAGAQSVLHPDQIDPHPARRSGARSRGPAHRGGGVLLHRDLGPARLEADRARYPPAGPAGRGAPAADRSGHLVRGAGGPRIAGALGRRGAAA